MDAAFMYIKYIVTIFSQTVKTPEYRQSISDMHEFI